MFLADSAATVQPWVWVVVAVAVVMVMLCVLVDLKERGVPDDGQVTGRSPAPPPLGGSSTH